MRRSSQRARGSRELLVVGAGGLGREVLWLASECRPRWKILGVLDDDDAMQGMTLAGSCVVGRVGDWRRYPKASLVVAIGNPRARRKVVAALTDAGRPRFATLIHPSVRISRFVEIGEGTLIAAGSIVTTDVRLGCHCVIDRMANVSHDDVLGDFCIVSPGVALGGNVTLGDGVWVGAAASVRPGIRIGAGSMIGMGAAVVSDVAQNTVVAGCPARAIKSLAPWS